MKIRRTASTRTGRVRTMTKSNLTQYTNITRNHSNGRGGQRVCKITPHYMAARWSGRQCADYFASTTRQASSNYCVGVGGDIAMSVDERDRAWTSSSSWNDNRSITIECGNLADSSLTDETWQSLVSLCVDICKRYGFRLSYTGDRNGSLTEHRMFASTDCPGSWLHARMGKLAETVNAHLDGMEPAPSGGIAVDGWWGGETTRRMQEHFGTVVDGIISDQPSANRPILRAASYGWDWSDNAKYGSQVIRRAQAVWGARVDGWIGPETIRCMQRYYGVKVDGVLSGPSLTVMAMQRALNAGTF
jgi:hypothetical protein